MTQARSCAVAVCNRPADAGGTYCAKHGPSVKPPVRGSRGNTLSAAARVDAEGTPHCPQCGGTSFTARRSNKQRALGVATAVILIPLMPKRQVQCVTCGAKFNRG